MIDTRKCMNLTIKDISTVLDETKRVSDESLDKWQDGNKFWRFHKSSEESRDLKWKNPCFASDFEGIAKNRIPERFEPICSVSIGVSSLFLLFISSFSSSSSSCSLRFFVFFSNENREESAVSLSPPKTHRQGEAGPFFVSLLFFRFTSCFSVTKWFRQLESPNATSFLKSFYFIFFEYEAIKWAQYCWYWVNIIDDLVSSFVFLMGLWKFNY